MTNTTGFNMTTKSRIVHAEVSSMKKPEKIVKDETGTSECMDVDNSGVAEEMEVEGLSEEETSKSEGSSEDEYLPDGEIKAPQTFNQKELSDFIRDLGLPKDGAEYLASVHKKKNLLAQGTTASFYRDRKKGFRKYFTNDTENSLVFCTDVKGLVNELKPNSYKDEDWSLFIDSSKRSLKAVLLHNGNKFASIPIAHSTKLKETYETLEIVL